MKGKLFTALALVVLSVRFGWAQSLQYTERLSQGRSYVGNNVLHLEVTTTQRPYTYTFPNMLARIDRRLQQFILAIPTIEPDLADRTVLDTMTPEERAFLTRLLHVDRSNPIIIRIFFPPGVMDLSQLFTSDPVLVDSEVQMGGMRYKTPAQVQGLYQDDQMLMSFSLLIDNTMLGIPQQAIEDIQFYSQGVRLSDEPNAGY